MSSNSRYNFNFKGASLVKNLFNILKNIFISKPKTAEEIEMFEAIEAGNLQAIEQIIEKHVDIHAFLYNGMNPLAYAAHKGQLEIVKYLARNEGMTVAMISDSRTKYALDYAKQAGHEDIANYLQTNQKFLHAVTYEDIDSVREKLMNSTPDFQVRDELGNTALVVALIDKNFEIAKLLIEHGADVNGLNVFKDTLLVNAIGEKDKEVVSFLIEAGADVNAKGYIGYTPLIEVVEEENDEIVKLLIQAGVDVNLRDDYGRTPLIKAIEKGNEDIVKLLVEAGVDVEASDKIGRTPLIEAIEKGNKEIVKLFIEAGADVNFKDDDGETLLSYAMKEEHTEIADLLRASGAVE